MALGLLFGADTNITTKETYSPTYAQTYHKPFEQFSPQYQMDYVYQPNVMIESPGARGPITTTKKEAVSTQEQSSEVAPSVSQADTEQQDLMTPLLILGGLAVVGYVVVNIVGKKK